MVLGPEVDAAKAKRITGEFPADLRMAIDAHNHTLPERIAQNEPRVIIPAHEYLNKTNENAKGYVPLEGLPLSSLSFAEMKKFTLAGDITIRYVQQTMLQEIKQPEQIGLLAEHLKTSPKNIIFLSTTLKHIAEEEWNSTNHGPKHLRYSDSPLPSYLCKAHYHHAHTALTILPRHLFLSYRDIYPMRFTFLFTFRYK